VREDVKMRRCEDEKVKMRRCEDEKMFYRPPLGRHATAFF